MTGIARYVANPQIKALLRETDGIGTPATQAAIIQRLFDRRYIEERKRLVYATPTGRALIQALPAVATQPDLTALWESGLRRVQAREVSLVGFLHAVRAQLADLVTRAKNAGPLVLPGAERRPCCAPGCTGLFASASARRAPSGPARLIPNAPSPRVSRPTGMGAAQKLARAVGGVVRARGCEGDAVDPGDRTRRGYYVADPTVETPERRVTVAPSGWSGSRPVEDA